MRHLLLWSWLGAVGACTLCGCKSASKEQAYPNDPLLVSKRPVAAKPEQSRPSPMTTEEPQAPPLPPESLVRKPAAEQLFADQSFCQRNQ